MNRRWLISRTNWEYLDYLSRATSISPVLAQILVNRGIKNPKDIIEFLRPGISSLSDPYDIPDMRKAVLRIKSAIYNRESILIHGDYDVDGLTGTAILVEALRKTGIDVHYFIPDRFIHGYGFNIASVEMAKRQGIKLIITVDCGITSIDVVALARSEGIDVIITDHHEPLTELPQAVAVLNPKLSTDSGLSGSGVALKLVHALSMEADVPLTEEDFLSLFDLAALGAVADVVPLIRENRVILKQGLSILSKNERLGLRALKEVSGLKDREIKAGLLSFTLIPRINAVGRLGNATDVVRLFLSRSEDEAWRIADLFNTMNSKRQAIEAQIYEEALKEINQEDPGPVIILSAKNWHPGVIGIVASRIAEQFYRPTFIFTIDGDVAKGSARSIPAFDICRALSCCKDMLLSFGGHKQAAGLKLPVSNLSRFSTEMTRIARESLGEDDLMRILKIDSEVSLTKVNHNLIRELSMLEPFGYGNPEPLLGARLLHVGNLRVVGNNHLKVILRQGDVTVDAVGFNMGGFAEDVASAGSIDAAFIPRINDWNGGQYLQINLKALRPSR